MTRLWLKRLLIIFLVFFLLATTAVGAFLIGIGFGIFSSDQDRALSEDVISGEDVDAKIGILRLEGIILTSSQESPFSTSGIITASQVKRWLREISQDEDLKALVVEVNSPGGSPVASDEIYQALTALRQTGRSVVVVMQDTATSGAYFISVAADKIIANPATLTGSIGVITEITNLEELMAKLGIKLEVYTSGEFKDLTSPARERTEEEKLLIQEYIDSAYKLFIRRVVEGRGMDEPVVKQLAQGQIYSGEKALELGLIDELGSIEDGVEIAKSLQKLEAAKIIRYRTESPLDILLGRVGSTLNPLNSLLLQIATPGLKAAYLPRF